MMMKVTGWKVTGSWPHDHKKFIIIVAPHTSNWDFLVGVMARGYLGFKANYLAKKALFKKPFGWFFKRLGGIPVDRSQSTNLVEYLTNIIHESEHFVLAIAPEGTRKDVDKWKTGFYHIAKNAEIPILMTGFDYPSKSIVISDLFYPGSDSEKDILTIRQFHKNIRGKYS